jgi:hypothetical protein
VNATAGATMAINIHSLANASVTDADTFNAVLEAVPVSVPGLTLVGQIVLIGLLCVVLVITIAIKKKHNPKK